MIRCQLSPPRLQNGAHALARKQQSENLLGIPLTKQTSVLLDTFYIPGTYSISIHNKDFGFAWETFVV